MLHGTGPRPAPAHGPHFIFRLRQPQRARIYRPLPHVVIPACRGVRDMRCIVPRQRIRDIGPQRKKLRRTPVHLRLRSSDRLHTRSRQIALHRRAAWRRDLQLYAARLRAPVLPRDIARHRPTLRICQKIPVHLRGDIYLFARRAVHDLMDAFQNFIYVHFKTGISVHRGCGKRHALHPFELRARAHRTLDVRAPDIHIQPLHA